MSLHYTQIAGTAALSLALFAVGLTLGGTTERDQCHSPNDLAFINPQLRCETAYVVDKQAYIGLKHDLKEYIETKITNGELDLASVYFRDLYNGPTLGLSEHEEFVPASLLKLPLLLAYTSFQSERPGLFDERLVLMGEDIDQSQYYPSSAGLQTGVDYSVKDLLQAMIVHSDNRAFYVLRDYLIQIEPGRDLLLETYFDVGLIDPDFPEDRTISVKSYAAIFQQLYHSSYLSTAGLSNEVLELLAESEFAGGLVAGVPRGIEVAHKFGERSDLLDEEKQLHDCGIVYYPDNAYLLCVMTRGKNFSELNTVIQDISAMVYEEFDLRGW